MLFSGTFANIWRIFRYLMVHCLLFNDVVLQFVCCAFLFKKLGKRFKRLCFISWSGFSLGCCWSWVVAAYSQTLLDFLGLSLPPTFVLSGSTLKLLIEVWCLLNSWLPSFFWTLQWPSPLSISRNLGHQIITIYLVMQYTVLNVYRGCNPSNIQDKTSQGHMKRGCILHSSKQGQKKTSTQKGPKK